MKQLILLCIFFLLVSADKFLSNKQKNAESLSIAMRGITEKLAENNERIDIQVYGTSRGIPELNQILMGNKDLPWKIEHFPTHLTKEHAVNQSAFLIFES